MTTTQDSKRVTHIREGAGTAWWVLTDTFIFKAVGEDTDGRFALIDMSIPSQSGPPPHVHKIEDEAYYILEGEFMVFDGNRTITVQAGDYVHIPPGTLHWFKNTSSTTSRMLVLITPAGLENFFFEIGKPAVAGQPAPPPTQADFELSVTAAPKYGIELHLPAAS